MILLKVLYRIFIVFAFILFHFIGYLFLLERDNPNYVLKTADIHIDEPEILSPKPVFDSCEIDKGGVVLMFDDLFVDSWYDAHLDIFSTKGVKSTFYLTRLFYLYGDDALLHKVLEMQAFGHEMGNHTKNHVPLDQYLLEKTPLDYFYEEVNSMNKMSEDLGISFFSFAYRGGIGDSRVDDLLLDHFKTVRYTFGRISYQNDNIYYQDACNRILYAGSIDLPGITKDDISLAVQRAYEEKSILVVLGHKILPEITEENAFYRIDYETLNWLIDEVYEREMEFYTVSEVFYINE